MKIVKGQPSSVYKDDQIEIAEAEKNIRLDTCPTCEGEGKTDVPAVKDVKDKAYWWWRKLKGALSLKPDGVELLLMGNRLVVIPEPDEEVSIDADDVKLTLGDAGKIKYITSEVKFQFDENDKVPEDLDREALRELAKATFNKGEDTGDPETDPESN